jgi:hypothetical protein
MSALRCFLSAFDGAYDHVSQFKVLQIQYVEMKKKFLLLLLLHCIYLLCRAVHSDQLDNKDRAVVLQNVQQ